MNGDQLVNKYPKIILFDGVCNLCAAWVHFVIKRDPQQKFKLASVQSPEGQLLLAWCGLPIDAYDRKQPSLLSFYCFFASDKTFWRIMASAIVWTFYPACAERLDV